MGSVKLGLLLALRRRALSLMVIVAAMVPTLTFFILLVVDGSSRPTDQMLRTGRFGAAMIALEPASPFDSVVRRDGEARRLQQLTGSSVVPSWYVFEMPVTVNGASRSLSGEERDWSDPSQSHVLTTESGRLPKSADECAITPALRDSGLNLGADPAVGGRPCTIVGVATSPIMAGKSQYVFVGPGHFAGEQFAGRTRWLVVNNRPTAASVAAQEGLDISFSDQTVAPRSQVQRHPWLFGVLTAAALAGVVAAIRFVTSRQALAARRLLTNLGASRGFMVRTKLIEATSVASVGLLLGMIFSAGLALILTPRIAYAAGIQAPPIPVPWVATLTLVIVVLSLSSTGALVELTSGRRISFPTPPAVPVRVSLPTLAKRMRQARRSSTRALLLTGLVTSLAASLLVGVVVALNALDTRALVSQWRQGDIALVLRGKVASSAVLSDLESVAGTRPGVFFDPQVKGSGHVGLIAPQSDSGCNWTLAASPHDIEVLLGRAPETGELSDLASGKVLVLRPELCSGADLGVALEGESKSVATVRAVTATADSAARAVTSAVSLASKVPANVAITPSLVLVHSTVPLDAKTQDRVSQLVEADGYPATDLRFGVSQTAQAPLIVRAISYALYFLLLAMGLAMTFGAVVDDAATWRQLTSLGAGRRERAGLLLGSIGVPLVTGVLIGSVAGLGLAWGFFSLVLGAPFWLTNGWLLLLPAALVPMLAVGSLVAARSDGALLAH